ncbi:MAG: metal-dependent hydrolase [candidate division Zixibacteria bacterium]|jgi:inner membrane protein|nr:metal-dependent hydrolase [candidate division Zixibacteria bacterium]
MDSLSQLVLGAAVGEVTLGEKVGNRALLWGAVAGTIPDLDVLFYPLMDAAAQLSWHRGISHSLLFNIAFAPVLGWVLYRINGRRASIGGWIALSMACLLSAVLLDCFTVYGTQLFQPFSNYQVGFNNISIIDPLFTVPLLAAVLAVAFIRRSLTARKAVILMGLGLSTAYMGATIVIKEYVGSVFEESLQRQQIEYDRLMTAPTLFNSVLWQATAEVPGGYRVGYYSLFDTRAEIEFTFVPRNEWLLNGLRETRAVRQLLWFSDGWYAVEQGSDSSIVFSDLRFGEIHTRSESRGQYMFNWKVTTDSSGTHFAQLEPDIDNASEAMHYLWDRIRGK